MSATAIGLLHPGEMGALVGACARERGARVLWASAGRGAATRRRAAEAGLEDAGSLEALVAGSRIVLSVCPPHAALDQARAVAALGFGGLYVDANAVSPATAREVGRVVEKAGAAFVDGSLVGPPPREPGQTRLYLSCGAAARVAACFAGSRLEAIVLDGGPGAASALKMAYAAWTKGGAALLLAVRALARAEGVDGALLAEWERSQPGVAARSDRALRDNARKAWRFVGEMQEMAAAFADTGLPPGFAEAAAEVYRRLADYRDAPEGPAMAEAAGRLASPSGREPSAGADRPPLD